MTERRRNRKMRRHRWKDRNRWRDTEMKRQRDGETESMRETETACFAKIGRQNKTKKALKSCQFSSLEMATRIPFIHFD